MPIRLEGMTLYTVKDIEELLGIGNSTVRRYISEGRLRGRKVARRWYIPAENLLQFFNDSEQTPPAELIERLKALDDFLTQKENKPEPVRLIKRGRPPKKNRPEAIPAPEPTPTKAKAHKQVTRRSRQPEVVYETPPEPAYVPPPTTVVVEVRAPEPPPATIVYAPPPEPAYTPPPAVPQTPQPPQAATVYAPPAYTPPPAPVRPELEPYIPPPPPPAVLQPPEVTPQQAEGSEIEQLLEQARRLREEAARLERIYGPEDQ